MWEAQLEEKLICCISSSILGLGGVALGPCNGPVIGTYPQQSSTTLNFDQNEEEYDGIRPFDTKYMQKAIAFSLSRTK